MNGKLFSFLLLSAFLLLSGCAGSSSPASEPTAEPIRTLDIGGSTVESDIQTLALSESVWTLSALSEVADELIEVRSISAGAVSPEDVQALQTLFPDAALDFEIEFAQATLDESTEVLDLTDTDESALEEAAVIAALLPALREIDLPTAPELEPDPMLVSSLRRQGKIPDPIYDTSVLWSMEAFARLHEAVPAVELKGQFLLFGTLLSCESSIVKIINQPVGDEGLSTIRLAMPLLEHCYYFLLQDCDIDYELLSELRDEYPEKNVVWRVHAGWCAALTDTERIWWDNLTDENAAVLKYCTRARYVDIGHNKKLSDISFVRYMPDLEVLIISMSAVTDLTPLTSCKKLEFLELFSCHFLSDLSPLAECTSVEYLNIGNLRLVTDISPLYNLCNLKRLRTGWDHFPKEQKEEIQQAIPDCIFVFKGFSQDGWRTENGYNVERYVLLRQQINYTGHSPYVERDTDFIFAHDVDVEQAFTRS